MLERVSYEQFSVFIDYLKGYYLDQLSIIKRNEEPNLYYISNNDSMPLLVAKGDSENLSWYVKDLYKGG
tara:strand:- start:1454 stop:1660 length:207 start_codon:yes stop_codon:yes gene_type:complete